MGRKTRARSSYRATARSGTLKPLSRRRDGEPAWLTVSQLARRWQLGRTTIYKIFDKGTLPVWKVGTHVPHRPRRRLAIRSAQPTLSQTKPIVRCSTSWRRTAGARRGHRGATAHRRRTTSITSSSSRSTPIESHSTSSTRRQPVQQFPRHFLASRSDKSFRAMRKATATIVVKSSDT